MPTRSRSRSPDSRPSATTPAPKAKKKSASAPAGKDVVDQFPPQSITSPAANTDSGPRLTDSLVDKEMDELAVKIATDRQKRKDLDDELERNQSALRLLPDHPRGYLPDAVPSSAEVASECCGDFCCRNQP